MEPKLNSYWLGRQPGYQGPRILLGDQGRNDKLATGMTSALLSNQGRVGDKATERQTAGEVPVLRLRQKTKIGTWNIRGINKCGKLQLLSKELCRVGLVVRGLAETKSVDF